MSGGVDSSVSAALLHELGYRVIGITLNLWDYSSSGGNVNRESGCCSIDTMADARAVCHRLGAPHYVLDLKEEFRAGVRDNFRDEYFSGRTPNPCVRCNTFIKWGSLLRHAEDIGAEKMATGHYARVDFDAGRDRWLLLRARDLNKDQSYALWGLRQEALAKTIFPLGNLTKPEVREIARSLNLKTAEKPESQEICFIPDNDYRRYLRDQAAATELPIAAGPIYDTEGAEIGRHEGIPFYTVGQRKGIGVAAGRPLFITRIDAQNNAIFMADRDALAQHDVAIEQINWIDCDVPELRREVTCKIRYKDAGAAAMIIDSDAHSARLRFDEPQFAITPGQSAVMYDGDRVVGGGVIERIDDGA
jgi:tRNA-specific 2-thiouridylase